jgi:hypothetical protein
MIPKNNKENSNNLRPEVCWRPDDAGAYGNHEKPDRHKNPAVVRPIKCCRIPRRSRFDECPGNETESKTNEYPHSRLTGNQTYPKPDKGTGRNEIVLFKWPPLLLHFDRCR